MRGLVNALFSLVFLLSSGSVFANEAAVLEALGGGSLVAVKRDGKTLQLKKGEALQVGDELTTDGKTAVDIRFSDRSLVRVGANSVYKLEPDQSLAKVFHRLILGIVRVIVPPTPQDSRQVKFRMQTPEGTIGVRGTEFVVITGNGETTLKGLEGEVSFGPADTDLAKQAEFVSVMKGFQSSVKKGGKPSAPVAYSASAYLKSIDAQSGPFGLLATRGDEGVKKRSLAPGSMRASLQRTANQKAPVKAAATTAKAKEAAPVEKLSPNMKLFMATQQKDSIHLMQQALKEKADPNAVVQAEFGLNSFHSAVTFGDVVNVQFLIKASPKPDLNARTKMGDTPLMLAVTEAMDPEIAELLMMNGADPALADNQGLTALQMAEFLLKEGRENKDKKKIEAAEALVAILTKN